MANSNPALKPIDDHVAKVLLKSRDRFERFLAQRLRDPEIARDLLQESLVRAITKSRGLRDSERLVPWFFQILRNALIDYYRNHAAQERRDEAFFRSLEETETRKAAARRMQEAVCSCMSGLLPSLKPEYGDIIKKVDLEERSVSEVARAMDLKPNNVMVKLHRARQALKKSLERACGSCAEHGCLNCSCH